MPLSLPLCFLCNQNQLGLVQLKVSWRTQPIGLYLSMATMRATPLHRKDPPKPQSAFHPAMALQTAQNRPLKDQTPSTVGAVAFPLMDAGSPVPTRKNTRQNPQKPSKNKHLNPFTVCYSDIKIILSFFKFSHSLRWYKKATSDSVPFLCRLDSKVSFNLAPLDGLGWVTHVHRYVHW